MEPARREKRALALILEGTSIGFSATTARRPLRSTCLRVAFAILTIATLSCTPTAAYAEAPADSLSEQKTKTLRVATFPDGAYMEQSDDGTFRGFNIDYLKELALHANWDYEYVTFDSWTAASEALARGEVDLLPSVHYVPERDEQMLFSSNSVGDVYTTIHVRLDDTRYAYEDFESFEGMKVGTIEGSQSTQAFLDYSEANGFSAQLVSFANLPELMEALDTGAIDALTTFDLGHVDNFKMVAHFSPESLYIALPKDREALRSELDQSIDSLKSRYPDFFLNLYKKYFSINTNQDPVFTRDEYLYLNSAPTLKVAYASFRMPLSFTDPSTGDFTGISASLFADISRITGLAFEFVPVDSQREAVNMVTNGEVDLVYSIDPLLDDLDNKVRKTGVYLSDPMAMVAKPASTQKRLALPEGFSLSDEISKDYDTSEIRYYPTPKRCFDAIIEGEADAAFADINVANYLLAEPQYSSLGILSLTDYTNSMSLGASPATDPRLIAILDRCVQFTSDKTMTKWITDNAVASHPASPIDIMRQYPIQIILATIGLALGAIATVLYISRSKTRNARKISQLVDNDQLTGGWSFSKFQNEAYRIVDKNPERAHAIVYIDINRFKSFNAAFGFAEGDHLLIALNDLLASFTKDEECYARVSADQFVVLIRWRSLDELAERFESLERAFSQLAVLEKHQYHLSLRAGASTVSAPRADSKQLLSEFIDCARYARESAESSTRSALALYSEGMREQDIADRVLQTEAARALENGEFIAYYQPKVHIATGRIDSFEALVRWDSPTKGLTAPDKFISLLEKSGLITKVDLQVFALACQRIRDFLDDGLPAPVIACNFSRIHLQNDSFPDTLLSLAEHYDVPTDHLELEATESIVMEDLKRTEIVCKRLKAYGFQLSIDDFGKGYSSLGALQDIPTDVLKIDKSLLADSTRDARNRIILEGIIAIAENLGVKIVVEGVETLEQATMLQAINPNIIAQGFLYSRPVPRPVSDEQFRGKFLKPRPPIA
ncbi:MAG: EAL domain-containing protein [Gordonibacter sp.]